MLTHNSISISQIISLSIFTRLFSISLLLSTHLYFFSPLSSVCRGVGLQRPSPAASILLRWRRAPSHPRCLAPMQRCAVIAKRFTSADVDSHSSTAWSSCPTWLFFGSTITVYVTRASRAARSTAFPDDLQHRMPFFSPYSALSNGKCFCVLQITSLDSLQHNVRLKELYAQRNLVECVLSQR